MSIGDLVKERRPHRADAARKFDAILAAAGESFAETGIDGSLEDIAARAGEGVATLYRNFPTREDLVESVYVAEVAAVCAFADEVGELGPWEGLETWLEGGFSNWPSAGSESDQLLASRRRMRGWRAPIT